MTFKLWGQQHFYSFLLLSSGIKNKGHEVDLVKYIAFKTVYWYPWV